MASYELTCAGCGKGFEARSSRAKWCSSRCQKRAQRKPAPKVDDPGPPAAEGPDSQLVSMVRQELAGADRLDTVPGQMAIELARKMAAVDATGVAGLSKELWRLRSEALAGVVDPAAAAPVENGVEAARRRREEKAAAAAAAAES